MVDEIDASIVRCAGMGIGIMVQQRSGGAAKSMDGVHGHDGDSAVRQGCAQAIYDSGDRVRTGAGGDAAMEGCVVDRKFGQNKVGAKGDDRIHLTHAPGRCRTGCRETGHVYGEGPSLRQRLTKWIEPAAVGRERSAERGDADFVRYAPKWSRIGNTQLLFLSSRPV